MPDKSSSERFDPAGLGYRGFDIEAMTALQMRNIDAIRRMANLMFDSTAEITRRQTEFLKTGVEQMNTAFEPGENGSDPNAIFERQTEAYRDLFGAFTAHAGELAEITSECCAGMLHEATETMADLPAGESRTTRPAKAGGAAPKTSPAKK